MYTLIDSQRRRIVLATGLALMPTFLLGASQAHAASGEVNVFRTVKDLHGRTVKVPSEVKRFVCTGSGALRVASYLGALDRLVGIESSDLRYKNDPKRDYAYAHHDRFKSLPVIGKGGGTGYTANPEAILALEPDVILTGYAPEAAEQLARETSIPVISVYYLSQGLVNDSFLKAVQLAGTVLGREERAKAIVDFIENVQADLQRRVQNRGGDTGPTVYPGAVTFSGAHGFAGTYSRFGPLAVLGARSISDRPDREGFYETDLEFVLQQDPDLIFLDPGNLSIVAEEVKSKRDYFASLKAVKTGNVYAMPSYNQYSTNIAYSLANAYYAGTVLFRKQFADVDFAVRFNEIVTFFNGRGWYDRMAALGQPYGKIAFPGL